MTSSPNRTDVVLSVPARTEFLQLLRLNIAGIAADAFTIDEIEDLKIAMEEFAALVMALPAAGDRLEVRFELDDIALVVTGQRPWSKVGVLEAGEFLPMILDAVVDRYSLDADATSARFMFAKTCRER